MDGQKNIKTAIVLFTALKSTVSTHPHFSTLL